MLASQQFNARTKKRLAANARMWRGARGGVAGFWLAFQGDLYEYEFRFIL
jgi:hypothetical protein